MMAVFWISVVLLVYTYAGYPLWVWLRARWRLRPVARAAVFPSVSVVMAVHNEAPVLADKLRNLSSLDYPSERYEIVVISDGSTDGTNQILASAANDKLRVLMSPENRGKAAALNEAVAVAKGEIVVFTDARQWIDADAIRHLVANFADPSVGCVSGNLSLGKPGNSIGKGVGLYWQIEKQIRRSEAATGSMVGTTGALYAVRRKLLVSIPKATVLDDVYIPMYVVRQHKRVVFEPSALAWDDPPNESGWEFRRKVRTLLGNYQLIRLAPWLVTPKNPLLFEFMSHKMLRLLGPFLLSALLVSSLLLPGPFYRTALAIQAAFYLLALAALIKSRPRRLGRIADVAFTFVMLNTAALVALLYFVSGKRQVWTR
jgi:biofilm PGA synthesis N-glycosyltransferase PgaC